MHPERYSSAEEAANAITHGIGLLLSIGGGIALVSLAARHAGAREITSASVFAATLVVMYVASTLYHAIPHPRAKRGLKVFDHCAIFLLIAGTYTPFTIVALKGTLGWWLFGIVWGLAVLGIVFKLFFTGRMQLLSTITYVLMGWIAIVAVVPISRALQPAALYWLIAGGIAYTAGTLFYHNRRIPYSHAIWHLFVLAGSVSHFIAILLQFTLPASNGGEGASLAFQG
ncbi:MAG: hemolysin III family protein [Candidatus Macondimonas sp.]